MPRRRRLIRITETGKGKRGSIFVVDIGRKTREIRAKRVGRTVGGLQIWQIGRKKVYLKSRRELKEVVRDLIRRREI